MGSVPVLKPAEVCRLLEQEKVAAVPGIAFGADDYLRISYATAWRTSRRGWTGWNASAKAW